MRRGVTDLSGPAARLHPESNLWVPDRRGFERTDRADGISAFCEVHRMRICMAGFQAAGAPRARGGTQKCRAHVFSFL